MCEITHGSGNMAQSVSPCCSVCAAVFDLLRLFVKTDQYYTANQLKHAVHVLSTLCVGVCVLNLQRTLYQHICTKLLHLLKFHSQQDFTELATKDSHWRPSVHVSTPRTYKPCYN